MEHQQQVYDGMETSVEEMGRYSILLSSFSKSTIILSAVLLILISRMTFQRLKQWQISCSKNYPPSPSRLPIIGHMQHMRDYEENPWDGFCALREKLGNIYSLQMGCRKIVVISSMDLMREVLIEKGQVFADRPDFSRYHTIFDGDRENALALCDWSRTQRMRRVVATLVVLPRFSTHLFRQLNYCIKYDMVHFLTHLSDRKSRDPERQLQLTKPDLLFLCGNIFSHYLCSRRFDYGHQEFGRTVWGYDYIFWDINQSYVFDFLPWLKNFAYRSYFRELSDVCIEVRRHMEDEVITPRLHRYMAEHGLDKEEKDAERGSFRPSRDASSRAEDESAVDMGTNGSSSIVSRGDLRGKDFLDVSLEHHFKERQLYPWHVAVFEVLDLIGGSSAVGNLLLRLFGFLALSPEHQDLIYREAVRAVARAQKRQDDGHPDEERADEDTGDHDVDDEGIVILNLMHRLDMPLLDSAIQETLRLASSPIIPHVASRDASLSGYDIDQGTMVLFNTFHLNFSEENWRKPYDFEPRRFLMRCDGSADKEEDSTNDNNNGIEYLSPEDDGSIKWQVRKPKNFLPFSVGRRACLGYKLTKACTFSTAANILLRYRLTPATELDVERIRHQLIPRGGLGLPIDETCFKLALTPRPKVKISV